MESKIAMPRFFLLIAAVVLVGSTLPLLAQSTLYRIDFNPNQDVQLLDKDEHGNAGLFINVRFTITLEGGTKLEDLAGADYKLKIEEDGHFMAERDVPRPKAVENLSAVLALDTSGSMKERNRMVQAKSAAQEFLKRLPGRADCG